MKNILFTLSFALILISVSAQNSNRATEIFNEVDSRRNGINFEKTDMKMVIYDSRGNTRNRTIRSFSHNEKFTEKSLLIFEAPANVKGTAFLTINDEGNESQKLYLPALGKTQTITASQKADRFMGSDFTYEDLGDQNPDDYSFDLMDETATTAILRASKNESSQYAYINFFVNTDRFTLERAEYFNDNNEMIKRLEAENFSNVDGNIWRANKMTMFDLITNRKTELSWSNRVINEPIESWRFRERGLTRGN